MKKKEVGKVDSKSQTWSIDILLAISIFTIALIVFFFMLGNQPDKTYENLQKESDSLPERLIAPEAGSASDITFVIGNKVDRERLKRLTSMSYEEIKNELGLVGEFCIHFEDENGHLIDINESPEDTKYTIGSPKLTLTVQDESGAVRQINCGS